VLSQIHFRKVIAMIIGDRIRSIREEQNLSQGDIQSRTGLLRCYVSRVENGHTIPSVETLEKFARALVIPLYRFFYEGKQIPDIPSPPPRKVDDVVWGSKGKDILVLNRLRSLLGKMEDDERRLLLHLAKKMTRRSAASASGGRK
jgi:transcriptional regulator with XRE-family HTH domain